MNTPVIQKLTNIINDPNLKDDKDTVKAVVVFHPIATKAIAEYKEKQNSFSLGEKTGTQIITVEELKKAMEEDKREIIKRHDDGLTI